MASRTKDLKTEKKAVGDERYLNALFELVKKTESLSMADKQTHFNNTEIRLLGEVMAAQYAGKRLISTQLAKLLGVTRSAVSQIVNRLEGQGLVKRVADEVDRKIAYIEITEDTLEKYREDLEVLVGFVGRVVKKYGVEKFDEMCQMFNEFYDMIEEEKADFVVKRKYTVKNA